MRKETNGGCIIGGKRVNPCQDHRYPCLGSSNEGLGW